MGIKIEPDYFTVTLETVDNPQASLLRYAGPDPVRAMDVLRREIPPPRGQFLSVRAFAAMPLWDTVDAIQYCRGFIPKDKEFAE